MPVSNGTLVGHYRGLLGDGLVGLVLFGSAIEHGDCKALVMGASSG